MYTNVLYRALGQGQCPPLIRCRGAGLAPRRRPRGFQLGIRFDHPLVVAEDPQDAFLVDHQANHEVQLRPDPAGAPEGMSRFQCRPPRHEGGGAVRPTLPDR